MSTRDKDRIKYRDIQVVDPGAEEQERQDRATRTKTRAFNRRRQAEREGRNEEDPFNMNSPLIRLIRGLGIEGDTSEELEEGRRRRRRPAGEELASQPVNITGGR